MFRKIRVVSSRRITQLNWPTLQEVVAIHSQQIAHAFRVLAPTLFALTFAALPTPRERWTSPAHRPLWARSRHSAIYAGAVICFGGLIFAGIRMMSGRFQDAIPGLFGALFGAGILGWGAGWIGSLTGQSM